MYKVKSPWQQKQKKGVLDSDLNNDLNNDFIKITEMWKCKNKSNFPLQPPIVLPITNGTTTTSATTEK